MNYFVGIDLGSTHSLLAWADEDGRVEVAANREGSRATPSVVYFRQGKAPLVGQDALDELILDPGRVVQFVKREMGNPAYRFQVDPGDPESGLSAEEISALILQKLKKDAEGYLGQPIRDVVVTVPAWFRDAGRNATMRAGSLAGLNVLELIDEPVAAALAYGLGEQTDRKIVLVLGLGSAQLDVTLLERDKGRFRVLATDGDSCLGGKNFDDRLLKHLVQVLRDQKGIDPEKSPHAMARLRELAEKIKIKLSNRISIPVGLQVGKVTLDLTLSRSLFEVVTVDLLRRVEDQVVSTLQAAELTWKEVDSILLVGGATRMPMVSDRLRCLSGRPVCQVSNPEEAVAIGAACRTRQLFSLGLPPAHRA